MPKVGRVRMPMLGTGKISGYTLLEVLAVIVLIGLILALAVPSFNYGSEQATVKYVYHLFEADLKQAREEAATDRTQVTITYDLNGYRIQLPDAEIVRDFNKFDFTFHPQSVPDENKESAIAEFPILKITADGKCNLLGIDWKTPHLRGGLYVDENGAIEWNSGPEKDASK